MNAFGHPRPAARIAVTSGKGGTGKTAVSINLAVALARLGHRVSLVDADFALGTIDVTLGLAPDAHVGAVLTGERSIDEVAIPGPSGIRIVPAGSGIPRLAAFDADLFARLVTALSHIGRSSDFLVLDTAPGIGDSVLDVVGLADYMLVVTACQPAALVDAYALIKLVSLAAPAKPVGVLVNGTRKAEEGHVAFRQLDTAARTFLRRPLDDCGQIPEDAGCEAAMRDQQAVVASAPDSPASQAIRRLAVQMTRLRPTTGGGPWGGSHAEAGNHGERGVWP